MGKTGTLPQSVVPSILGIGKASRQNSKDSVLQYRDPGQSDSINADSKGSVQTQGEDILKHIFRSQGFDEILRGAGYPTGNDKQRTGAGVRPPLEAMSSAPAAAAVPLEYEIGSPKEKSCDVSGFSDISGIPSTVDMHQDQAELLGLERKTNTVRLRIREKQEGQNKSPFHSNERPRNDQRKGNISHEGHRR